MCGHISQMMYVVGVAISCCETCTATSFTRAATLCFVAQGFSIIDRLRTTVLIIGALGLQVFEGDDTQIIFTLGEYVWQIWKLADLLQTLTIWQRRQLTLMVIPGLSARSMYTRMFKFDVCFLATDENYDPASDVITTMRMPKKKFWDISSK